MSFFLLRFRKGSREQPVLERFEDADRAMAEFSAAEQRYRGSQEFGVVLLIADDEETLRRTHGHYFYDVDELLAPLG